MNELSKRDFLAQVSLFIRGWGRQYHEKLSRCLDAPLSGLVELLLVSRRFPKPNLEVLAAGYLGHFVLSAIT